MKCVLTALVAAFLCLVTRSDMALAQPRVCLPREDLASQLADRYREAPVAMGLVSQAIVMEVYRSESGTWTIVMNLTNGTSCMVASGEAFEEIEFVEPRRTGAEF